MQRPVLHVVRGAVVTVLSLLLITCAGSLAAATQTAGPGGGGHRDSSATTQHWLPPGAQITRGALPRLPAPAPGLLGGQEAVPVVEPLGLPDAAAGSPSHSTTRSTADGRAPPA